MTLPHFVSAKNTSEKNENKPYIVHSFLSVSSIFLFGGRAGLYF